MRKSRAFTSATVVCLALGIGASTGIFSIVNAVLLKPLAFRDSERLARVYTEFPTFPGGGLPKFPVSPPEFREIQQQQPAAWDQIEAWSSGGASLQGASEAVRITACYISGGMLPMLGVPPMRGRVITPSDDMEGVPLAMVLSEGFWKRAFGGDPQVIGRETLLDGRKSHRCRCDVGGF